jgi:hypothetical protein
VGLALAPLPDLGSGRGAVHDVLASAHPVAYAVGGFADLLAYLSLLTFAVGATGPGRAVAHHREAGLLAATGGATALAAIMTAAALGGSVVLTRGVPLPEAEVVLTAASLATWLSLLGIALVLAACAVLGGEGMGVPTWCGRAAAGIAVLLAAAVPLATTPVAHVPALLLDLWLISVAVLLLRREADAAS